MINDIEELIKQLRAANPNVVLKAADVAADFLEQVCYTMGQNIINDEINLFNEIGEIKNENVENNQDENIPLHDWGCICVSCRNFRE